MHNTVLLRFVGQDGDYGLTSGLIYPCKIYSKDDVIWIRARNYAFKFPKKYVRIPYNSFERMSSEWVDRKTSSISKKVAVMRWLHDRKDS